MACALAAAGCREPPAREVRRIGGAAAEVRAIGLRAPDVVLQQAFQALGQEPPAGPGRGARGEAVDRAVAVLRAGGARKGLVNFGGGRLAVFGEPLTVAVRDPGSPEAPRWATLEVREAALATVDRDPQAGQAAVLSATVVAGSAAQAEALASAAVGLDADQALALLAERQAAGFVLVREGDRKVLRATPGFAGAHRLEATPGVEVRP